MSNQLLKTYRLILILVVFIELVLGYIFLNKYYQQIKYEKEQEQLKKISFIDKKNLVFPDIEEFKYYWKLEPNTVFTDQPDWLGYQVKYTYNADGLNERFDYEVEKPANTFRIVALGDSFTFGQFVNTEYNWPEQLEDILNNKREIDNNLKFEVINLGVSGFDIPYLIKRYRDVGTKYNPDLIIWFESGSGFTRLNELEKPATQKCFEEYEKNEIDVKNRAIHPCYLKTDDYMSSINDSEEFKNELISRLDNFLETIESNKIIFFSFSERTISSPELLEPTIEKIHKKHPDVKYLPIIEEKNTNKTRLPDEHPNKFGHQLIARVIFEYLKHNFLN